MSDCIIKVFIGFAKLISNWLKEAHEKNLLKFSHDFNEITDFIVIPLNGCAALYSAMHEPKLWELTIKQINFYINELKK